MMNYQKYKRFEPINFKERTWPDKVIEKAPTWVSVDLRDGNQALITPMKIEEKVEMFQLLVDMGFKEIEVGFPSSSQIEYDFLRILIEENLIPDDVTVQVLTQAREHLIRKTFESLKGLKRAIVHVYNSTSVLQRDVVFNKDKEEIKKIAVDGVKLVKELSKEFDGEVILEYSPESFTGTEVDYAMEVCEAVLDTWEASPERKVIINLPSTVEMDTPNVYADQIEWMCRHFKDRNRVIVSVHPHNDRGCGVASTELALLAGADRVEGTLFGNGERTGNVDIVTLALNMFTHGIDPKLELGQMNQIKDVYEKYLSGKSIVLQTVGDSITWGLNHCTPEQTYTAELCKLFAENTSADIVRYDSIAPRNTGRIKGFERIEVRNNGADRKISIIRNGVGGDSVLRALKRYEDFTGEITEGLRPDIITLLFGVNDALENDPMKFVSENIFKTNLQLLIKTIYNFNPEAAVVLLTPSYNDDGTTDKSCLDKYAKKVKEVGVEFNIPVIDIHKKWMEHLITGSENNGQREWLSNVKWDMTHLSPIGSRAMAEHIFDGLKNLIK